MYVAVIGKAVFLRLEQAPGSSGRRCELTRDRRVRGALGGDILAAGCRFGKSEEKGPCLLAGDVCGGDGDGDEDFHGSQLLLLYRYGGCRRITAMYVVHFHYGCE